MFKKHAKQSAYTLVEIMVVLVILAILTVLALSAMSAWTGGAQDNKNMSRAADILPYLETFRNKYGYYPTSLTPGQPLVGPDGVVIAYSIPSLKPSNNNCYPNYSDFVYAATSSNSSYTLSFCLNRAASSSSSTIANIITLTPRNSGSFTNVVCTPDCGIYPKCGGAYSDGCGGYCYNICCNTNANCQAASSTLVCSNNNCIGCTPTPTSTCAGLGYNCGTQTNSCGAVENCGSCSGGTPYCSNDQTTCIPQPDCPIAICGDGRTLNCSGGSQYTATGSLALGPANASGYHTTTTYQAVLVGSQCWMNRNLNIGKMILNANSEADYPSDVDKWCVCTDAEMTNNPGLYTEGPCCTVNTPVDTGLYTWALAMWLPTSYSNLTFSGYNSSGIRQGICPVGWHVPSDAEFSTLSSSLGSNAGDKIKDPCDWNTCCHSGTNCNLTNLSMPMGGYHNGGQSTNNYTTGFFWTTAQPSLDTAHNLSLYAGSSDFSQGGVVKTYGYSVRCIHD